MKRGSRFLYALDIGSSKMVLSAAAYCQNTHTLGPILIESQPSKGIFKGVVSDMASLSDAIQSLCKRMEAKSGAKIVQMAVSINGDYIQARQSVVAMALAERGTRSVTKRDLEKLISQARILGLELDEELLHEYPKGYSIDRNNMILNPLGLQGRRFEMNLLLICAQAIYLENIKRAIERAGFSASELVFCGVAASEAILLTQEKEKGVVLIDIGEALTNVLVYKNEILRFAKVLPFGGYNLSETIANHFKIPFELASGIKESSLDLSADISGSEDVMIKTDMHYRSIKKRQLMEIILPEIENFIDMLKGAIEVDALMDMAGAQIVVTGGLSLLEGLLERIEHGLGLPVKMGVVRGLKDVPASRASSYAAAIGLLNLQKEKHQKNKLKLILGDRRKFFDVFDYVKTLYQDYF
ncbi:MAG: cell division protein FtsA [Candidatus Omnitrophota bacterium]